VLVAYIVSWILECQPTANKYRGLTELDNLIELNCCIERLVNMRCTLLLLGYQTDKVELIASLIKNKELTAEIIAYPDTQNLTAILQMVNIDCILLNHESNQFNALSAIEQLTSTNQSCKFMILADILNTDVMRKGFLAGAMDCLQLSVNSKQEVYDAVFHTVALYKRDKALRHENAELALLRAVIDTTPSLIMVCDPDTSLFITFNQALNRFLGLPSEQVKSRSYFHISEQFDSTEQWFEFVEQARLSAGHIGFEVSLKNAKGKLIPFEFDCFLTRVAGREYLLMTGMEISRLKQVQNDLEELATKDPLTHLRNRRGIAEEYERLMKNAIRSKSCLALAVFDLDDFKKINDQYGHDVGDNILIEFANVLRSVARRPLDLIVRAGGEEFVVIMIDGESKSLQRLLNKIVSFTPHTTTPSTTVSGGAVCLTGDSIINYDQVFKIADNNLYKAKQAGKNRLIFETL